MKHSQCFQPLGRNLSREIFSPEISEAIFMINFTIKKVRFIFAIRIPRLKPWAMIKIRKKPWSAVPDNYRDSVIISPVFF